MEDNEDEPDDVKQATPVEEEITKGEIDEHSGKPTIPIELARRRHHCEKDRAKNLKKSLNSKEECCRAKLAKAARAPKTQTVLVYDKECTLPKIKCIPRHCLSKEEWIDILATPKRTCPPPCFHREVTRKIRPVSTRIAELAQPPKTRLLNTLQDRAGTLPAELVDNLIQTLEGEACLTPEQAERMFRDKDIRARKKCRKRKSKLNCKGMTSRKREEPGIVTNASLFDKEAVSCQYQMAESFVKSILEWKTPIPKEEFKDIAEVILKRLGYVLEYNPVNGEDRKSQQMRFLADIVASWISGVLFDVAEAQREELEKECERKRKEMEEESEEESDDESVQESDGEDDDDDDDEGKGTRKEKGEERKPPKKRRDDKEKKGRGDRKDDDDDDYDDDKKGGMPEKRKEDEGDAEEKSKEDGNVEEDESQPGTKDLTPDGTEEPQEKEEISREEDGTDGTEEPGLTSDEKITSERKPEEMEDDAKLEVEDTSKEEAEDKSKDATKEEITDQQQIPEEIGDEPVTIEEITVEDEVDISEPLTEAKETEPTPVATDGKILSDETPVDEEATTLTAETDERAAGDQKGDQELSVEPMEITEVSEIPEAKEKDVIQGDAGAADKEVQKDSSPLEDTAKIVDELTGIGQKTSQPKRKPSKIPSSVALVKMKKFQTDTPFVTFDKIFHTIYNAIEESRENSGEDAITNRIHRAVYEKCLNVVQEEKPAPLPELTKDVLEVLSGKIALWLRDVLTESQLSFMNKFPATVESVDVREWTKWIDYVSDTANTWSSWIQQTIRQAEAMRSGKVTRGDWLDWTKSVGEDALLWRRFYLESLHQAHQNLTMIRNRQVVKTGTRILPGDNNEREMKITDLEMER